MQTCAYSMSAAATAIPTSSSSSTTPPSLSNLSLDYLSLNTINFSIKPKPIKPPKLRSLFPNSSFFSRSFVLPASTAAAAFDDGASAETSDQEELEEEEEEDVGNGPPLAAAADAEEEEDETGDIENEGVVSLAAEERRLYVGNLPYSMTSSQLADLFAEAGRVISVEVIYDKVTDRSRGFAFVTMGSVEEAKEAIRMFEGSQVGGRTMKVNFPEVPKGGEREVMGPKIRSSYQGFVDSPHKIYAGNLSWGLTSQGLREAFANQPGLLSAKVIYDRDSGRSRGFGFVTFASAEEVESALDALNGVEVEGRPLRLNLAEGRAPTSTSSVTESNSENELESSDMVSRASI